MTAPGTAREEHQSMEFSVTKSALLNELSTTQGVVERKTTIPILSNLLVEAKGSQLTITATDLDQQIRQNGNRGLAFDNTLRRREFVQQRGLCDAEFHRLIFLACRSRSGHCEVTLD